jgi:predicted adenylyl cyclase CyaB
MYPSDMSKKPRGSEEVLVEVKARCADADTERLRRRVLDVGSKYVGTFHQIDTYFNSPKGYLKLRETEGGSSMLIYYERDVIAGSKESNVLIVEVSNPSGLKNLLKTSLGTRIVVEKSRQIFHFNGTEIHLDSVKDLGTFIELERLTKKEPNALSKSYRAVMLLVKELGINEGDLLKGSYSNLLRM